MLRGYCRDGGHRCCVYTLGRTAGTGGTFGITSGVCHTSTISTVTVTIRLSSIITAVTMPYASREC